MLTEGNTDWKNCERRKILELDSDIECSKFAEFKMINQNREACRLHQTGQ